MSWVTIPSPSQHCFGCGTDNPHGLKMEFETNGEQLRSSLTIPGHLRGWSNLAHGGVISTLLDEIMGWSGIHLLSSFLLTKDLKVRFKRPIFIGDQVIATGWVEQIVDDRHVILAGQLTNPDGDVLAKASGEFVLFSAEAFQKMGLVPAEEIHSMQSMFREQR